MTRTRVLKVGVMGPGESATVQDLDFAKNVGRLIAENRWILLSGGRESGVMGSVNEGYALGGGICSIGISPRGEEGISKHVSIVISTNMGSGRNYINAISSDVMIAIGDLSSAGTLSEVAMALISKKSFEKDSQHERRVILLGKGILVEALAANYDYAMKVSSPEEAVTLIKGMFPSTD